MNFGRWHAGFLQQGLMASRKQRGFSLLELMITISISLIIAGVGYISLRPLLYQSHVNTAYDTTLMTLRNTRNLAITQSLQYVVTFNAGPPGTIQIQVQPGPVGGVAQPIQQVMTYTLPADVSFAVQAGFPVAAPDGFGAGATALDFESTAAPGVPLNPATVVFMPDGSAQDTNRNLNNGVVYLTQPNKSIYTSRAVTVWGATGRVRGWRLNSVAGTNTWVQQ